MTQPIIDDIRQLVQEGRAAALAGDTFAARERFRRATELDPNTADAWLGLSSVVPILAEKRDYLQRVLALEPGNTEAQASLAYVEKLLAEGMQLAPSRRHEERIASGDASPLLSAPAAPATDTLHCYRHPERETGLRCIQCNRPICGECARVTPVGQLCPECRRERRPRNYQVSPVNIVVGGVVALVVSALVSFPIMLFARGFFAFFLLFLVGPMIAELIVRAVDWATKLKRGRPMQIAVGAGIALGVFPWVAWSWVAQMFSFPLVLFMVLAIVMAVARLK